MHLGEKVKNLGNINSDVCFGCKSCLLFGKLTIKLRGMFFNGIHTTPNQQSQTSEFVHSGRSGE